MDNPEQASTEPTAGPPASAPPAPPPAKSSLGMEPSVLAGLAVLFHWLGGLIVFLVEKESAFARFYALQTIMLDLTYVGACILSAILGFMAHAAHLPFTLQIGSEMFGILFFVFWVVLLVNAFSGKVFKLPGIGPWAAKQSGLE